MSSFIKNGSSKLKLLAADPDTQKAVKSALKVCTQNGIKSLLIVAEGIPVLRPVAILFAQLIEVCAQAKCNKNAFAGLKERLNTFGQLFADLVENIQPEEQTKSLTTCMENLFDVMTEASKELGSYT